MKMEIHRHLCMNLALLGFAILLRAVPSADAETSPAPVAPLQDIQDTLASISGLLHELPFAGLSGALGVMERLQHAPAAAIMEKRAQLAGLALVPQLLSRYCVYLDDSQPADVPMTDVLGFVPNYWARNGSRCGGSPHDGTPCRPPRPGLEFKPENGLRPLPN